MKKLLLIIILGGGVVAASLVWVNYQDKQNREIDALTFSNTMEWDSSLYTSSQQKTRYSQNWQEYIEIDQPPANSSDETRLELNKLIDYKSLRTEEKIKEINQELELQGAIMGGRSVADYFGETKYPLTALALGDAYFHISTIVLAAKDKFNRVRPHFLESKIEPVIDVPGHPAYPSGHSTQSHFVALVLGELMPSRKQEFWEDADRIAKNREIAGVHYPSDSAAGAQLAQQFFNHLLQDPQLRTQLSAAR